MLSTLSPTTTTTTSFNTHHSHSHAPSSPSPEPQNGLQQLVQEIKDYLGTTSGIDSEDIDPSYLKALMNKYVSNPSDWQRYAIADPSKNYTRNAVENINGKANILVLVWNPQKGSPVHDHANAHCVMKILSGSLKEEIFNIPSPDSVPGTPLETKRETLYAADQVTYISDKIGLHRISNPCEGELAVSLHLYTPPNAADFGYHIYDEKTGQSKFCKQAKATLPPKM